MLKKTLNPQQTKAVKAEKGPLLIIAGAGTGKTTVITERIKYLILEKKVPADRILALTFTEKAAHEMEERIDRIMPYGYFRLFISTFHSFCDAFLREEGINTGISPNFKLLTESESILFLRRNLFKLNLSYFRPLGNPNKFLEALLQHFSRLKDEDITPNEYLKWAKAQLIKKDTAEKEEAEKYLELAHSYSEYEELKDKEGVLDFSDLISKSLHLLRTRRAILKEYQEKFLYILIDEFQDTNYAQNELAILLSANHQNINVVADDDQAIYRWRGAALSNVLQFKNNFPGTKIITLSQNYRSTQEILDRSYKLIQFNNPYRLETMNGISKKLTSDRKIKGEDVVFLHVDRVDEEAEIIAKTIKESIVSKKKYKYSDIAILVRANIHAQPITQALLRLKIPYQFLGPSFLFNQEEIKDLIAYLKVLYNLEDSVSMYRVLNMSVFDLNARDISTLLTFARKFNLTLFEAMQKTDETFINDRSKSKIKKINDIIDRHLKRVKKDSAGQILYYFLIDTGLFSQFTNSKSALEEQRAQNVAKFFDRIKTYETVNPDSSIYAVVDWIELSSELGESPVIDIDTRPEMDAVNILTVHSSKGLEFPVCFMVNLVPERFPTRSRKETIPIPVNLIKEVLPEGDFHIQEERRLFYVGMTRAKDLLYLTAAKFYGGAKREKKISPFVYEAMPEILEQKHEEVKKISQLSLEEITSDYSKFADITEDLKKPEKLEHEVDYLTYSQLQSFDICPLHYKAGSILHIPTPTSAALSFGSSIHNSLKDFYITYQKSKLPTKQNLLDFLSQNWISQGYASKIHEEQMKKNGVKILSEYYDLHLNKKTPPLAIETPFTFYLPKEKKKGDIISNVKISGKIDRIDKVDGNVIEIIDYKTGKPSPMSKRSYNLQLGLYALAATESDHKILKKRPEDIIVSLFYLETGEKISTKISPEDLKKVEEQIRQKITEIENSDFKCSKNIICKNCEYKMLCNVA